MLKILSNIIELTNRRPQGKTLKTHKVVIWSDITIAYIEGEGALKLTRNFYWAFHESHMLLY